MDQRPTSVGSVGTPTHMSMHMQGPTAMGSPSVQPMTPQVQPMTPQGIHPPQTPGGHYQQDFQQQPQQQYVQQGQVPPSPGGVQHMGMAGGDTSPGMYPRQMMPQGMMQQQQLMQQQAMMQQAGQPSPYYQNPQQMQQQQQWAQQHQQVQMQPHFARQPQMMGAQPGQNVMIRRVPYPAGPGYPGGMQPAAGQPPPGAQFAARPGPGQPQPPQMQRPVYPPSAGPPAQGYPGTSVAYPPGAQAGFQPSYQQPMYPARPQQLPQGMRPYMSPVQGQMVPPQSVFPPNAQQQPHTPQAQTPQPQPPFTPNGSRFPAQPTPSPHPHYPAAPDMRSPSLMSPSQQAMPRPMSNGDMVPIHQQQLQLQPMRLPPQPVMPSQFFTYDPNFTNVTPELCLVGCVFHIFDFDKYSTDKMDYTNIQLAIAMHGGIVDFGPKTFQDRLQMITHIIVDSHRDLRATHPQNPQQPQMMPFLNAALNNGIRIVTLHWLADVLRNKQLEVPSKLAHLPGICNAENKTHVGKYISLSGFDEQERAAIKWMIDCIGAKMTPYLSRSSSMLIAKSLLGEKVEKANEWGIPILNYNYIADAYFGVRTDAENPRYQVGIGQPTEVAPGPMALEMMNELTKKLMSSWKQPISITMEQYERAISSRKDHQAVERYFPNKRLKQLACETAAPTDDEIERIESERGAVTPTILVAFSGAEEDLKEILIRKLRFLGGKAVDNVTDCTHLVCVKGGRSLQLLEAIALGKGIVTPYWIIHSFNAKKFLDTLDFFLRDEESEKIMGYSCKRSVARARNKPVFEDVTFYLTPSVEPSRQNLSQLIQYAGGKVDEKRPDPVMLANCIETDALYIVVGCESDLKWIHYLLECNFPVYSTEFVLMSVLRQEMCPDPCFRVLPFLRPNIPVRPQAAPSRAQAEPQRVRV